jgi:hypothetical protein
LQEHLADLCIERHTVLIAHNASDTDDVLSIASMSSAARAFRCPTNGQCIKRICAWPCHPQPLIVLQYTGIFDGQKYPVPNYVRRRDDQVRHRNQASSGQVVVVITACFDDHSPASANVQP